VRPAEPRKSSSVVTPRASGEPSSPVPPVPPKLPTPAKPLTHNPPRPIGPEALKRLREAIQSGEYPSDSVVRDGLERLIRRTEE